VYFESSLSSSGPLLCGEATEATPRQLGEQCFYRRQGWLQHANRSGIADRN
jgi:hypothetical protein